MVVVAMVMLGAMSAHADDRALRRYAGKLVISPDAPPPTTSELPAYLAANVTADAHYEVIEGSPWPFHVTAVLAKAAPRVTLVIVDPADRKAAPLLSVDVAATKTLVLARAEATTAAGFVANKTYVVRLVAGTKQVARATLKLRE